MAAAEVRRPQTRQDSRNNSTTSTGATNNKTKKLTPDERAFRHVCSNAKRHRKLLESGELRIIKGFCERVAEFPPARASGDINHTKKNEPSKLFGHLEGFFGAMYISEGYKEFQKASKGSGKGRPKHCFLEYAEHRGIRNHKGLPSIIRLGTSLLGIWKHFKGYRGIFLLLDRSATLRALSTEDTARLKEHITKDKSIRAIVARMSASIVIAGMG